MVECSLLTVSRVVALHVCITSPTTSCCHLYYPITPKRKPRRDAQVLARCDRPSVKSQSCRRNIFRVVAFFLCCIFIVASHMPSRDCLIRAWKITSTVEPSGVFTSVDVNHRFSSSPWIRAMALPYVCNFDHLYSSAWAALWLFTDGTGQIA
jgi:hypothetical protein